MRKIINTTIAAALALNVGLVPAYAQDNSVNLSYSFSNLTKALEAEGTVTAPKGKVPVVMTVEKDGVIIFADDAITSAKNADGVSEFTFDSFKILESMTSGNYKVTVWAEFINASDSIEFKYIENDEWLAILKAINSNIASNNTSANKDLISANISSMDLDAVKYSQLSGDAQGLISKMSMKAPYDVPEKCETDEELVKLNSAIEKLKAACKEGWLYATLYDATSTTAFKAWYDTYGLELKLTQDNAQTTDINEKEFFGKYFAGCREKQEFLKRMPKIAELTDKALIQEKLVEACILAEIETSISSVAGGIIDDYYTLIGVDQTIFSNADSDVKGPVYDKIAGVYYESYEKLAAAIDEKLEDAIEEEEDNDRGGSSGGSGRGSGVSSILPVKGEVNPQKPDTVTSEENTFTDMEGHAWAKDAVNFLYKRSIISGRTETEFDPGAYVTRAEFTKMLVKTYNLQSNKTGEVKFSDVDSGAWYAEFVKLAAANNIIVGDDNNCFRPNDTLKREDMAVIIYRASKLSEVEQELPFADSEQISSYAVPAVRSLYANKMVAGVDDNRFAPKETVTRAQAAQILYNVMVNTIK